jgi:hypothetical protein
MPQNQENKNDELDLLNVSRRLSRKVADWLISIVKSILIAIAFLVSKWIPLLLSLVLAASLTLLAKYTIPPAYQSELTIRSNTIQNADIIQYLNKLHLYTKNVDKNELKSAMNLNDPEVKKIKDIEAFWIIDKNRDGIPDYTDFRNKHNIYDTVNIRLNDRLVIRVRSTDPNYFPTIRDGLISYLNSNELFRINNNLRLQQSREMISRLNYDIEQLDSLQKIKYFEETKNRVPDKSGQMIFLQEQKTQLVYSDIYGLYEKKLRLEAELNINNGLVTVINDFAVPVKRYNGIKYYGLLLFPVIMGLTVLLLIWIESKKKIKDFISTTH